MAAIIAFCTCPDEISAARIADALVDERLAACVNRLPGIVSTYRWQGALCHDSEQLLVIKSTHERFAALRERILALHPYELPEVIALDVVAGLDRYLTWIDAQTQPASD
jgi:periplasmic divalent cation tolerance protein